MVHLPEVQRTEEEVEVEDDAILVFAKDADRKQSAEAVRQASVVRERNAGLGSGHSQTWVVVAPNLDRKGAVPDRHVVESPRDLVGSYRDWADSLGVHSLEDESLQDDHREDFGETWRSQGHQPSVNE